MRREGCHLKLWRKDAEGNCKFEFRRTAEPRNTIACSWTVLTSWVETKELKRRVRDIIDPGRDLGHVDGNKGKGGLPAEEHAAMKSNVVKADKIKPAQSSPIPSEVKMITDASVCEDCT